MLEQAAERLRGRVRRTPIFQVAPDLWFKCEFMQHTGTFKARGLLNKVLASQPDPAVGIVTASGGNAGLAAAWAARSAGVPAEIFVPTTTPAVKLGRLQALGATVVQVGSEYAEAYEAALKRAVETGAVYCHAYDQPEVVAGAGTIGLELRELQPDTVFVACGGGGLMAGIASAVDATVVAAEPELAPSLHSALAQGRPVDVPVSGVAADSLGARRLGDIAYDVAVRTGVRSVLVSDADIVAARAQLWHDYRIVVEHGAATAYAALVGGAYRPSPGERVVIVLCGSNTDPSDLIL
ncbi:threonine/serine dehydratase [Allorhizocola rhizosphaerae]|uniref:threonine/serine dehydratase n=1 Tax=Allorhizocola rhizosphaerae TaxID=1872709 RepID=UPI000E3C8AA4|nr:threonine/serine dehydratase [Allorhizocola rhizosphaerae]